MSEEKEQELQNDAVENKNSETAKTQLVSENTPEIKAEEAKLDAAALDETIDTAEVKTEEIVSEQIEEVVTEEPIEIQEEVVEPSEKATNGALEEIEENNAEDAEDSGNIQRHEIPVLDYQTMSLEDLTLELQKLIKNEKIQAIKKHVDGIKSEFDLKFQEFLDHKKEQFIAQGGNEIDFRYESVTKKQFNEAFGEYREKRNTYYKSLEKSLKENLSIRLEIIEELKGLVNVEEDINTTYKSFKDVRERWGNAGPIPRTHYNDVWKTYQHHIEIFYDFLNLNRELRDLDFKHNLVEKQKIVAEAEALTTEPNLEDAFRKLQTLHKIWKEDIGPVGKEHREEIWERFSKATAVLHQRRQDYYKELDSVYEKNLENKNEIIATIVALSANVADNHKVLQQQIKLLEEQRNAFFKAGKVPQKVNEKTWAAFKDAVRGFNRNKNAYYKNLKKDQQDNLDKKRALVELANSLKDSEDWDITTREMKRIQNEWKKIGHVPRKYSDKIWKEFKNTCNHYFDRLHALKNKANEEEGENLIKKEACLEKLKSFELTGDRQKDITSIKAFIEEWKTYGMVPFNKKNINEKFNKTLDAIFKKLDVSRKESELLQYGNKIKELAHKDNDRAIANERTFIRRKMDESKTEILQLENNLQFFSNASEDNPLVKDVIKRVNQHKESLETWKAKLKNLNIMQNNLLKEAEESNTEAESTEEK